ncbi:MAG: TIGR03915 family putative DNA repair protein [Gemmatimonadaceae bacterium]
MREIVIQSEHAADFEAWRQTARPLLQNHVRPESLSWRVRGDRQTELLTAGDGFNIAMSGSSAARAPLVRAVHDNFAHNARVSRNFLRVAASVACHRHGTRWDALYRMLFRLTHGESQLLEVATDPDVHRLMEMDKAVRRDVHKMHAFVRFRAASPFGHARPSTSPVPNDDNLPPNSTTPTAYIAWFEPQHHIVQRAAPFFARRFPSMKWSILTPSECAHWNGVSLQFTPGVSRSCCPETDELEELWRTYYAHIFNPARVSIGTMRAEMPQRYWVNLPEAQLIAGLARDAPGRVRRMLHQMEQKPSEIPEELRSRIGHVLEPERTRTAAHQNVTLHDTLTDLEAPGAWDPIHDPGVGAARERANPKPSHGSSTQQQIVREVAGSSSAATNCAAQSAATNRASECVLPGTATVHDALVRIGTASWTDPTLLRRGVFYPDSVATPEARLNFYATHFSLVEVDATYYVMPTRAMAAAWAERTPDAFVFDVKAFALMTGHAADIKRLPDWLRRVLPRTVAANERVYANELPTRVVDDVWQRFLHALSPLRDAGKLGPILLQFPRWFSPTRANANTLRAARERLGSASAAVEFRNPEWVNGRMAARTVALLDSLNLTYVVVDAPPGTGSSMPPVAFITTPDLSVIRLHGRRTDAWETKHTIVSERYRYLYDPQQLSEWSERIANIAESLRERRTSFPDMAKAKQGVHVVFNNCHANYGTSNAIEITKTLIEFDKVRRRLV